MAAAAIITPVKQQQQAGPSFPSRSRESSRRRRSQHVTLLQQATPEQQQRNAVMNSVHNTLAPALSLPSKKRSRELTVGPSGNKQQQQQQLAEGSLNAANALDEDSDLIRNGRALFAATTTSLAAPLDIPNKRRRTTVDAGDVLATPKHSAVLLNAVGNKQQGNSSRSRRGSGKKQASQSTATTAKSTFTRDTLDTTAPTEKRTKQEDAVAEWSRKYSIAIKGFTFYFDGFEDGKRREGERALRDLGAKTESFFSKSVTHVVTTRPIPGKSVEEADRRTGSLRSGNNIFRAPAGKENAQNATQTKRPGSESPSKRSMLDDARQDSLAGPNRRPRTRLGAAAAAANNSILALRTPPKIKPYVDSVESQDILRKAQLFNMKIWDVPKLEKVLTRLMAPLSPEKDNAPLRKSNKTYHFNFQATAVENKPSLPYLLRAEQITGSTYERDQTAARPDYHYFNRLNGYLLVEDISGEYQPAHAKEYTQRVSTADDDRETEWPTLHGGQEGRGGFFKPSQNHVPPLPPASLMFKMEVEPTRMVAGDDVPLLRRAVSLNALRAEKEPRTRAQHSAANLDSYQIASGNSQIITSNIASGTSTTTTRSGQVIGAGGGNSLAKGIIIDKRLARLGSKAKKHVVTLGRSVNGAGEDSRGLLRRSLTAAQKPMSAPRTVKEYVPKPGYCENCRVRYEDFKEHTRSKKHRRFALNPANWEDLDRLLAMIPRPVNRELLDLYEAAGCECPSDVEKSDNDDDDADDMYDEDRIQQAEEADTSCAGGYPEDSGYSYHTPELVGEAGLLQEQRVRAERKYLAEPACAEDEEDEDDEEEDEDEEESLGDADTSEEEEALRDSESGSGSIDDEDEEDGAAQHELIDLIDDEEAESL